MDDAVGISYWRFFINNFGELFSRFDTILEVSRSGWKSRRVDKIARAITVLYLTLHSRMTTDKPWNTHWHLLVSSVSNLRYRMESNRYFSHIAQLWAQAHGSKDNRCRSNIGLRGRLYCDRACIKSCLWPNHQEFCKFCACIRLMSVQPILGDQQFVRAYWDDGNSLQSCHILILVDRAWFNVSTNKV